MLATVCRGGFFVEIGITETNPEIAGSRDCILSKEISKLSSYRFDDTAIRLTIEIIRPSPYRSLG